MAEKKKKIKVTMHQGDTQELELSEKEYHEMMNSDQPNLTYLSERYFDGKKLSEFKDVNRTY